MKIGRNTRLKKLYVTWPHQVSIGNACTLENGVIFKFDGIWKKGPLIKIENNVFIGNNCEFNICKSIRIGQDSLIASGCKFIDHDHGIVKLILKRKQHCVEQEIIISNNVWIGCNAVILKGVKIGEGAVIGAGSIVTKDVLPYTIVAGIPATIIKNI